MYKTKINLLGKIMEPPVCPHMSFYHGRHGCMTPESELRYFLYEVQTEQWKIVRKLYYKYKLLQKKYEIRQQKIIDDINNIQQRDLSEICKDIITNRNYYPTLPEVKKYFLNMIRK